MLWAIHRANQKYDVPIGSDLKSELDQLGRKTEGGQFYPRLSELVESGLVTKADHPEDTRGFTAELTDDGTAVITHLFVRSADALGVDISESALPTSYSHGSRDRRGEV